MATETLTHYVADLNRHNGNGVNPKPARILIVDTELQGIATLRKMLERDFDVQFAYSGTEALSLLDTEELPDLILLEAVMPEVNGFEVCRKIKQNELTGHIPVLLIMDKNNAHDEALGLKAGAADYLIKPFALAITKARIGNYAKQARQERQLKLETIEHRNAREQLQVAGLVYNASSEAMTLTDANNRIMAVNPAFTALTGYSFEEVAGKDPKILGSGRHEDMFFQHMWRSLNSTGKWNGEIWNRHKNGEEYAVRLVINSIYDETGSIHQRVALFSDITEQKRFLSMIQFQANFDELTQLPNRRLFMDRLEHTVKKGQRINRRVGVMYIDLDHFKEVNDTLGHHQGDLLLVEAARRIKNCVRESDTVARLGGDEFTVILDDLHEISNMDRVAQNILDSLSQPFQLDKDEAYVSASIGITLCPDDARSVEDLLKCADQAMYAAKDGGRNSYRTFTADMQESVMMRTRLDKDLRHAQERGQLHIYFQPIVELATGHIHKAEAFLHWRHPELGVISPAVFIPIAEESGTIHGLGEWVFIQAANQARRWRQLPGYEHFQISLNMSPVQFRSNGKDFDSWIRHLHELGLPGNSINVDISEDLLIDTDAITTRKLFLFRDNAIQMAIDNFGSGYSSLSYLKKFDIDFLKIDPSFVRNFEPNSNSYMLAEAMVAMAHKLNLSVIAEGVETKQQSTLLAQLGCDYCQGYLFSKPLPAGEFEQVLTAQ
ncbi:EAL domain-containing protein [Candidatus Methylospira mobilis]|uniref:EAL domain-containing protein n=1 Tax=Candidatus Methylospira mobilis TaxID=1808979 RepID=A0A5Q0BD90_9GAMM|nr:EAL domain-containing protein [Candidatus Methylospira mobilis]QFY41770.1 EAL domain-containing protein [Candidatus Methylospira mobilis]WNV06632.1 EAL domain-containing protein [Candidatus Methylospira mobilis]